MKPRVFEDFKKDATSTFFVTYFRTGTHWLMYCLATYFSKLILEESGSYTGRASDNPNDFLMMHSHDGELDIVHPVVLYLYRLPVDVIFSSMYTRTPSRIMFEDKLTARITRDYKLHLEKWLLEESFTKKKTVISYDNLRSEFEKEFARAIKHFSENIDSVKIRQVKSLVTKDYVKDKTKKAPKIMSQGDDYNDIKLEFAGKYSELIEEIIFENKELVKFFSSRSKL